MGNLASCSRLLQDFFSHEHVAHRNTPIKVAQESGPGVLRQLAALHRLFSIVIRPVQRILRRRPHPKNPLGIMRATGFSGSRVGRFCSQSSTEHNVTQWVRNFCGVSQIGTSKAIDLRAIDRHPLASIGHAAALPSATMKSRLFIE
jgi:hypothetical protein